jgi:hypothetical protein
MASLLFCLELAKAPDGEVPLASAKRDKASEDAPVMSRCILCRFDGFSELLRDAELRVDGIPRFS